MFDRISDSSLQKLAEDLATIGEEEPTPPYGNVQLFARCLSVLMRAELARRRQNEPD